MRERRGDSEELIRDFKIVFQRDFRIENCNWFGFLDVD